MTRGSAPSVSVHVVAARFVAELDVGVFGAAEAEDFAEERAEGGDAADDEADAVFGVC